MSLLLRLQWIPPTVVESNEKRRQAVDAWRLAEVSVRDP